MEEGGEFQAQGCPHAQYITGADAVVPMMALAARALSRSTVVSSSRVTPSSLVTSNMSKMTVLKQPSVASGGVTMTATMRGRLAPTTRTLDLALDGPLRQEPNREQVVASTDDSSVIDIDNIKQTFSKEPLQPLPTQCV